MPAKIRLFVLNPDSRYAVIDKGGTIETSILDPDPRSQRDPGLIVREYINHQREIIARKAERLAELEIILNQADK